MIVNIHFDLPIYLALSLLFFYLNLWSFICDNFLSAWRRAFRIPLIQVCWWHNMFLFFWKCLCLHSFLKDIFLGYRILYWQLFSSSALKLPILSFLASIVTYWELSVYPSFESNLSFFSYLNFVITLWDVGLFLYRWEKKLSITCHCQTARKL